MSARAADDTQHAAPADDVHRGLEGRIALVAGAGSSGPGWSIGKASCVRLATRGATIVALDRTAEAAEDACAAVRAAGGQATPMVADLADGSALGDAIDRILEDFGRIDVLLANAGVGRTGGPEDTELADWRFAHQVNVESLLVASKRILPAMRERRRGAIVTVASVAGIRYVGYPHLAYSVTKAAVLQFTRMIAQQYAGDGIRANCVIPGLIDTPRIRLTVASQFAADFDAASARRAQQVPMRRMGTAWEVANAVAFLASDDASYITGTELVVDGGLTGKYV